MVLYHRPKKYQQKQHERASLISNFIAPKRMSKPHPLIASRSTLNPSPVTHLQPPTQPHMNIHIIAAILIWWLHSELQPPHKTIEVMGPSQQVVSLLAVAGLVLSKRLLQVLVAYEGGEG